MPDMDQIDDVMDDDALESQFQPPPDNANLKILPPYIFLTFFMVAAILEMFLGRDVFRWQAQIVLGMLLIGFGVLAFAWTVQIFLDSNTPMSPDDPSLELLTHGPFAFSRNPLYLSYLTFYAGVVILFDILWGVLFFLPLFYCVAKYAVEPEEKYLKRKFKGDYGDYSARVRRWL